MSMDRGLSTRATNRARPPVMLKRSIAAPASGNRKIDGLKGLAAVVATGLLVVGVPLVLSRFVGWPLPGHVPALDDVTAALSNNDIPDDVLVNAMSILCWFLWIELMISLLVEALAYARGRAAGDIPLAGGAQRMAARLVAAVVLVVLLAPHHAPAPRPATDLASLGNRPAATVVVGESTVAAPGQEAASAEAHPVYEVQHRDTLWDLAERHLGDPLRWHEIWDLNQGQTQQDGSVLTNPDLISIGWQLTLPVDAVGVGVAPAAAPAPIAAVQSTPPADEPAAPRPSVAPPAVNVMRLLPSADADTMVAGADDSPGRMVRLPNAPQDASGTAASGTDK